MKRKIICFVFALLMLVSVFPISIFASENSQNSFNLSQSEISDDFKFVFADSINLNDYPYKSTDKNIYFIASMEGCSGDGNVELYFYLYNPSCKQVSKTSGLNKVTMSIFNSKDESTQNEYKKYDISLIKTYGASNESGSFTNALILKFKLNLNVNYDTSVNRYYRMSDIEVLLKGNSTATAFLIGQEAKFFNDSKGNVNVSIQDLNTLEVDAFHTFYRVNTEGVDKYTDIQAVYFPVPKELLNIYKSVYSMNVEWAKYKTNLGLVVDDSDVADLFQKYWINNRQSDFKYSLFFKKYFPNISGLHDYYLFGYNLTGKLNDYTIKNSLYGEDVSWYKLKRDIFSAGVIGPNKDNSLFPLGMVFYSDDVTTFEKTSVFGEKVINYIDEYGWNMNSNGPIYFSHPIRQQEFTVLMDNKELGVYRMGTGWETFWFGDYIEKDTGEKVEYSMFQQIDMKDLKNLSIDDFSKKYKIDKYDVSCQGSSCGSCFTCNTKNEKYENCEWFLLRYDTTIYDSYEGLIVDNTTGDDEVCNASLFQTEVIRNFDTISVTLGYQDKDGNWVTTVFPIKRSPTNFSADVWNPSEKPEGIFSGDDFDGFDDFLSNLYKVVMLIVTLLLIIIFWDVIKTVLKIVIDVITLPFKTIKERKKK